MRVKFKKRPNVPKLEYGKTYEIVVKTVTWTYRFKFTRKKYVYMMEVNNGTVLYTWKMTKKELKALINGEEFTECVVEV